MGRLREADERTRRQRRLHRWVFLSRLIAGAISTLLIVTVLVILVPETVLCGGCDVRLGSLLALLVGLIISTALLVLPWLILRDVAASALDRSEVGQNGSAQRAVEDTARVRRGTTSAPHVQPDAVVDRDLRPRGLAGFASLLRGGSAGKPQVPPIAPLPAPPDRTRAIETRPSTPEDTELQSERPPPPPPAPPTRGHFPPYTPRIDHPERPADHTGGHSPPSMPRIDHPGRSAEEGAEDGVASESVDRSPEPLPRVGDPVQQAVLADLARNPDSTTAMVTARIGRSRGETTQAILILLGEGALVRSTRRPARYRVRGTSSQPAVTAERQP